ncbi:hypothetical protein TNCV_1037011 [Trichonephila clavipes]|nr:hypothetical protein TNCV_1037011 [Trichonephila clavipes]
MIHVFVADVMSHGVRSKPRNSSGQRLSCSYDFRSCFEHHKGDRPIGLGSNQFLRENTLVRFRVLLPVFPFHQPHERAWRLFKVSPCPNGIKHS